MDKDNYLNIEIKILKKGKQRIMVAHQGTDHMSEIDYIYLKLLEGVAKGFDYEKLAESCLVLGNEILGDDITELLNEHMSEVELGLELDIDIENIKGEVL